MPPDIEALGNAVRAEHSAQVRTAMAQGLTRPPVFPYVLLGTFFLPGLYLAIPHANRPWLYQLRWAVMALIVSFNVKMMTDTSGANPAMSFGAGLYAYWGIMNCFSALIWRDPQFGAERVLKVKAGSRGADGGVAKVKETEGDGAVGPVKRTGDDDAPGQTNGDGAVDWSNDDALDSRDDALKKVVQGPDVLLGEEGYEYYWEPFPVDSSFSHRFNWAMDLITNLRGEGRPYIPSPCCPQYPSANTIQGGTLRSRLSLGRHPPRPPAPENAPSSS